ncbi:immunoglobulin superfamily member 1-like isoform X2 [Hemicordylus capensis]|uniref:immunoglobulin superfamily member 1-like isoform X1 n=1 Tax=Hemicordylus capensis TaxID=884348 RepID=UPI0023042698|nr:immunoglobulin superfamily member 1-like isoform X1 [Hemicordylus capensis]XP_053121593.1 immunoglobulin superfamily member 1-like isoform X2 [Hemicordylus capensis]
MDHPPSPVFSVTPKKNIYISGEFLNLTCSAPDEQLVSRILFSKGRNQPVLVATQPPQATLNLSLQDAGYYSCGYQIVESGREIPSLESNSISVIVTDPPPSPAFSVTPKQDVYTSGESIDLTCSAPDKYHASRILYFKDSEQIPLSDPFLPQVTLRLSPQGAGNYSCSYQVLEYGQEIPSLESNSIHISVTESLLLPLAIGCGGGGGTLVLLVLLACLYKRKLKGSSRISARTYWNTLKSQQSIRKRRCKDPSGNALSLQKREESSQPMGQDWGVLPKSKLRAAEVGGPPKEKKGDEDADSGAEFEFPETDLSYTLLGISCSTFFKDENRGSTKEANLYDEIP